MLALPWIAIFLAAPTTSLFNLRWLGLALLTVGYGAALINGQLGIVATLPIALLALAAYAVSPQRKAYFRYLGHALYLILAIALCLHKLPGFQNVLVIDAQRFTADAQPFTMYLNLDKPLAGFWLLLVLPWIRPVHDLLRALKWGAACLLATASIGFATALLLGVVAWAPKLPSDSGIWLLNNLFLVTLTEEALFRGYIQGGLGRLLERHAHGATLALVIASLLFGLAHAGGGWQMIVLAGIAGLGYGLAFQRGGLLAAWLTHFGFNALHFFLFTYPLLELAKH
ncbi:CPBP family intramembrane metalloprotease [Chitinimonas arctica]|uniref:CPBP family intramembrane metalloprotease n=1 Tax=Chitinimonas arctica TaxID=2594795 RepID=A0A516SLC8_9NEIS|nr:CPBP family intramembrane glutamic endopeptidase [Chitinimonas arctica]QDQ28961.1 CPBP family intramembrane metalloprotease [Chitinimonas arctica]